MAASDTAPLFGLFLHWGLYSLDGIHEQEQWRLGQSRAEVEAKQKRFTAEQFDANAWLDFACDCGAEYLVLTAKHHEGFCLWDSGLTDFTSMNAACRRDFVAELAEACHRRAFPLGIYYSVVDWHHPNYPNQNRHHELSGPQPGDKPDWDRYMAYLKGQVEELCTRYGKIDYWWWDMNVPEHRDPSVNAAIHHWQPGIRINNRGFDDGDFSTPERETYHASGGGLVYTGEVEACESVSPQAWCCRGADDPLFTARYLRRNLARHLARGGRYLLNVGPQADGSIGGRAAERFREVGSWYRRYSKVLAAEPVSDRFEPGEALYTRDGNTLYVIFPDPPRAEAVALAPLAQMPLRARLLNDDCEVQASVDFLPMRFRHQAASVLSLKHYPQKRSVDEPLVFALEFDGLELPASAAEAGETVL